jgi:hypothetical protein
MGAKFAQDLESLADQSWTAFSLSWFGAVETAFGPKAKAEFEDMWDKTIETILTTEVSRGGTTVSMERLIREWQSDIARWGMEGAGPQKQRFLDLMGEFQGLMELPSEERAERYLSIINEIRYLMEVWWPGGVSGWEEAFETAISNIGEDWEGFVNKYMQKMEEFEQTLTQNVTNAFIQSLETGDFDVFKSTLEQGIGESIKKGVLEGFTAKFYESILNQLWQSVGGMLNLDEMVEEAAGLLVSGQPITGTQLEDFLNSFSGLGDTIDSMQPVWDLFNSTMEQLNESLGLNTTALNEANNLLARQTQLEDFINQLMFGELSPVQSLEGILYRYEDLLREAGEGADLQSLFGFISGTTLPFLQAFSDGGNYQRAFSGVLEDLRDLMPYPESDTAINLQSTINVVLEVDGDALAQVVVDQLQTNSHLREAVHNA